jgi:t-SNARE complex subunit (syntaxin)
MSTIDVQIKNINTDQIYNAELDNLISSVREVNEINNELNKIILSQTEKINQIDKNVDDAGNIVDSSNEKLLIASEYQQSIFWKKGGVVTLCTAIVATPAAVLLGPKIAVIAGVCTMLGVGYGVL